MSKLAVHIGHYKRNAVGSLGRHNWEKRGETDEHSNEDIDPTRSGENIALVLPEGSLYQDVKGLVEQSTGRVTAASIWVSEWIVYPPEELQDPKTADKDEVKRYFGDVLDWMKQEGYNVRMAVVHMDETTTHLQADTVPLTEEGKLSRKEVYTRESLRNIHTDLADYLAAKGWNIQRGDSTKDKQVRSKSLPEYKKEAEAKKLELLDELEKVWDEVEYAEKRRDSAVERADHILEVIRPKKEIEAIQAKSGAFGKVSVTEQEWEVVRKAALAAPVALDAAAEAAVRTRSVQESRDKLEEDLRRAKAKEFEDEIRYKELKQRAAHQEAVLSRIRDDLRRSLSDYASLKDAKKEAWEKRSEAAQNVKDLEAILSTAGPVESIIVKMALVGARAEAEKTKERHEALCAACRAAKKGMQYDQKQIQKLEKEVDQLLKDGVDAACKMLEPSSGGKQQSRGITR